MGNRCTKRGSSIHSNSFFGRDLNKHETTVLWNETAANGKEYGWCFYSSVGWCWWWWWSRVYASKMKWTIPLGSQNISTYEFGNKRDCGMAGWKQGWILNVATKSAPKPSTAHRHLSLRTREYTYIVLPSDFKQHPFYYDKNICIQCGRLVVEHPRVSIHPPTICSVVRWLVCCANLDRKLVLRKHNILGSVQLEFSVTEIQFPSDSQGVA